jgi:hypothetical protein
MSWIIPAFLQSPPLPSLPYDQWQFLVRATVTCIRIGGGVSCALTFVASGSQFRAFARQWGTFVPAALLLLPGVFAGAVSAHRFSTAFEVFHLPTAETGSYLASCVLWTAVPQFAIAIVARWLWDRWSGRTRMAA